MCKVEVSGIGVQGCLEFRVWDSGLFRVQGLGFRIGVLRPFVSTSVPRELSYSTAKDTSTLKKGTS